MTVLKSQIAEVDLVALLKNREKIALEYLYDKYSDALFGIINRIVQSSTIAEEILQDAFLRIWNKIDDYDAKKSRLFTWMLNISRNLAIDKIRSKEIKNSNKTDDIHDQNSAFERTNSFELNMDNIGFSDHLKVLTRDQIQIIDLIYYQGYSHSELSKEFGIPLGTVKTRARAALKRLRMSMPAGTY